jgi:hypothetical protein
MDSFKKLLLWLAVISLSLMAISGCTRKNNLTGNNWSNTSAKTFDDRFGLINGFSFPADTLRVISSSELKLITGNYQGNQAVAYMRFTGLPRQATVALVDEDSCFVNLMLVKRSPATRSDLKLRLYKINRAWSDTLSLMNNMEYIEGSEVTVPDSISLFGKEVKLKLRSEAVKNWETNADSTGWNIAVKVVDEGFVEFRAVESTVGASLKIRYKDTDDTDYQVLSTAAVVDNYSLTNIQEPATATWKLNNAKATRLFLRWTPTNSLFTDNDGNQLSAQEIKRLTVNRAIIVLHAKPNSYYTGGSSYSLFPFNLIRNNISIASPPLIADYQIINYTPYSSGALVGDSLEVDVTPLIQAFVSGEKLPLGITIQSTQERQNFGEIEFYDIGDATPAGKKPYLRISFTPPYLKQ